MSSRTRRFGRFVASAVTAAAVLVLAAPAGAAPLPISRTHDVYDNDGRYKCTASIGPKEGVDLKENGEIVSRGKVDCEFIDGQVVAWGNLRLQRLNEKTHKWAAVKKANVGGTGTLATASIKCTPGFYRTQLMYSIARVTNHRVRWYFVQDSKLDSPIVWVRSC